MGEAARFRLGSARTLVVKVGTSTVAYRGGSLNYSSLDQVVRGVADLWNEGRRVLLVSSGAIASGLAKLGLKRRPEKIVDKQALAAVGQAILMQAYEKLFAEYGRTVAQVLLTYQDLDDRVRRRNARNTLLRLLDWGVVPVINENDTVAVEEINFGDNDILSAMVASLLPADLLVILTDVEGLYTGDPSSPDSRRLSFVPEITPELEQASQGRGSPLARGGMASKLLAARLAGKAGVPTVVAPGYRRGVLREILEGEDVGTLFAASAREGPSRKVGEGA
jgi:glutamate 5-kinase